MLCAAFSAGFVDAIVGGGGLIQVPALFAGYPAAAPPVLLGTNKVGSICGATGAVLRYLRVVRIPWRTLWPAAAIAFLAALAGASLVSTVSPALFRPLVPIMLTLVLLYVLRHRDLGARHSPIAFSRRRRYLAWATVGGIGLYDGFFGPGTGSFFMLLLIRVYGFDFLHASASARTLNAATNAGALMFFGLHGEIHWLLGVALGACNASGSVLGAHTAVRHGSKFVRAIFIVIVVALIAKTAYDASGLHH
ncbi:MAG: TSUP family transporter [Steroidobacteraceae bacterium]